MAAPKPFDKTLLPKLQTEARPSDERPDIPFWVPVKEMQSRISTADDERLGQAAEENIGGFDSYIGLTRYRPTGGLRLSRRSRSRAPGCSWVRMALAAREDRCREVAFSAGGQSWNGLSWRHHGREPGRRRLGGDAQGGGGQGICFAGFSSVRCRRCPSCPGR